MSNHHLRKIRKFRKRLVTRARSGNITGTLSPECLALFQNHLNQKRVVKLEKIFRQHDGISIRGAVHVQDLLLEELDPDIAAIEEEWLEGSNNSLIAIWDEDLEQYELKIMSPDEFNEFMQGIEEQDDDD